MYSQLLHSHLLQSLGSAIIHSLWQSLLLLVIYKAIVSLKKDLTPAVKHNLSAIFVILTFGWFVLTFQQKYFASSVFVSGIPIQGTPTDSASVSLFNIPTEIAAALSIAYLVLLALLMTRLSFAIARTLRVHTSSLVPVDEAIAAFTKNASGILKIKRKVTVWIGKNISVPATIGFFKPIILLPAVCLTHLTPQQIEAIILHELSHIRRNDFLLNMVLVVIETILFFNPAVFIFMKTIREERENCCDDLVLNNNYEPLHYARALLTFSREQMAHQKLAMNAASRKHQLLYRIKRITGGDLEKPVHFPVRILFFALIAILFFSFSVFTNHHQKNAKVPDLNLTKNFIEGKATMPQTSPEKKMTIGEVNSIKVTTNQAPKPKANTKTEEQINPAPFGLTTDLEGLTKDIKELVVGSIASVNPANEKLHADLIEKEANVQVQQIMKQFSEKKLAALIQQKQNIFQNEQFEKELAYLDLFRKSTERKLNNIRVSGDSIILHSIKIDNKLKGTHLKGKENVESNQDYQFFITPDAANQIKVKIGKRLRTADI